MLNDSNYNLHAICEKLAAAYLFDLIEANAVIPPNYTAVSKTGGNISTVLPASCLQRI